jgi:hypothetical protein
MRVDRSPVIGFIGSAQEFVEVGISSRFPEGDEFGLGRGHSLSFEQ